MLVASKVSASVAAELLGRASRLRKYEPNQDDLLGKFIQLGMHQ